MTRLAVVSMLAGMESSENEKLRADNTAMAEENANQAEQLRKLTESRDAARDERDAAIAEVKHLRSQLVAQRDESLVRDRRVALAVAEFGASLERHAARQSQLEREHEDLISTYALLVQDRDQTKARLLAVEQSRASGGPYRSADDEAKLARVDELWHENEKLAARLNHSESEQSRIRSYSYRQDELLLKLRRATRSLTHRVGVLRRKVAEDPQFRDVFFGDIDQAVIDAIDAAEAT